MLYMYCKLKTREKQPNNTVDRGEELATYQLKIRQAGTEFFLILVHWNITEFDTIGTFSPSFTHYYRSNAAYYTLLYIFTSCSSPSLSAIRCTYIYIHII